MGTNRTRRVRTREHTKLDDSTINVLLFGTKPERGTPAWEIYVSRFFGHDEIKKAWDEHRDHLMKIWKDSGRHGQPWALTVMNNE